MTVNVVVTSRSDLDKISNSQVEIAEFSKGSRTVRGLRAISICWLIAIFCILVPILHFVLVPAFFFLGIFMFFQQSGLRFSLVKGQIHCPSCKTELNLKPGVFDWPKREICSNCRADLLINTEIKTEIKTETKTET